VRQARRSSEVPHGTENFRTPAARLSLQVSVLVGNPRIEGKFVLNIADADKYADGHTDLTEATGVGRQFVLADLNVGGAGPGCSVDQLRGH
jgi:hypothetical protein